MTYRELGPATGGNMRFGLYPSRYPSGEAAEEAYAAGKRDAQVWYDEAGSITPRMIRYVVKRRRVERAKFGWTNWYINRGRLPLDPSRRELRAVSWRRVL